MRTSLVFCFALMLTVGCDDAEPADAGTGGADAGPGTTDGGAVDAGGGSDGGGGVDAGGGSDAGDVDAGGTSACPCFGATEIAAIEAHAAAGGSRGCMTMIASGTVITGALSSTDGPENLQVDVSELTGIARVDWTCASGCSDLNDDTMDDCAGAALPSYATMIITEAQHDACEALIQAACD